VGVQLDGHTKMRESDHTKANGKRWVFPYLGLESSALCDIVPWGVYVFNKFCSEKYG
jgi:hypothetical protein